MRFAQEHWAAQLVAAVGAALSPPAEDDSHTALAWDAGRRALAGARDARLLVETLTLEVGADRLPLAGRTRADALAWLGEQFDRDPLPAYPHVPPGPPPERFVADAAAQAELARRYGDAAVALAPIGEPIRVWPHHFDMAALVTLGGGRTIGSGLSPGDGSYADPYYYVMPWPYPAERRGPDLAHGRWHVEGWFGAVLGGADTDDPAIVRAFLDEANRYLRTSLSK